MQISTRPPLHARATRVALACATVLLTPPALEIGYRLHSHRPPLTLKDWRAARIEALAFDTRGRFDPRLGWTLADGYRSDGYNTLAHGIRRNFDETEVRTGAILAVGDVYTDGGTEVADDETWPAQLERILGVPVVNGGVAGYATDQVVLRAEQLLPIVRPRTLVVGLFEASIGRAGFSSYGVAKPYYTVDSGKLTYHPPTRPQAHVPSAPDWLAKVRGILGYSALLDSVLSRVAPAYWQGNAGAQVHRGVDNDPVAVTCALLGRLKARADAAGARVLLLMQYARNTVAERTQPAADAEKVAACAASAGLEVVDQFDTLRAVATASPAVLGDLYLQRSRYGQMSREGNRHAAELVVGALHKTAALTP